jgi:large subunit ribosomal protein L4e
MAKWKQYTMKIPVFNLQKEKTNEVELPKIFNTPIRHELIKKAVVSLQSRRFQPQGRDTMAGKRTTAESRGTGHGIARVPRLRGSNRAAFGVSIVGGHAAFPPTSIKKTVKRINKKEKRLAIRSAIAATANKELVEKRGHKIKKVEHLPIIINDELESLEKTSEVKNFLKNMDIWEDVERADRRKVRAGKGKMRGRKHKKGKGPLFVVLKNNGILYAARNLPGVDIVEISNLNIELLAPGAHPGRLTIWTMSAILQLDNVWMG